MSKQVLFLCTGNYYRSRFAEIFFNSRVEERGLGWRAQSRGLQLFPENIGTMSVHTVARLRSLGVAIDRYQRLPAPAAVCDFEMADQVVAVKETEHRPLIAAQFPAWLDRIEFWEVHDLDVAGPHEAMPHLEREVLGLIERLAQSAKSHSPC